MLIAKKSLCLPSPSYQISILPIQVQEFKPGCVFCQGDALTMFKITLAMDESLNSVPESNVTLYDN